MKQWGSGGWGGVGNVHGSLTAELDGQHKLLMSLSSASASDTEGKCHSYHWRAGGWSNNQRVVWCQRSDGVNVTGEERQRLPLLPPPPPSQVTQTQSREHTDPPVYKYMNVCVSVSQFCCCSAALRPIRAREQRQLPLIFLFSLV